MKQRIVFIVILLAAFFFTGSQASAMYARKIARQAVTLQNESFREVLYRPISGSAKQVYLEDQGCYQEIFDKADSFVDAGPAYKLGFYWTIDKYFFLANDARALLTSKETAIRSRGKALLRKASGNNGKRIARSLIDHAYFIGFYLDVDSEQVDTDFCQIRDRIIELGDYSVANVNQAMNEIIDGNQALQAALSPERADPLERKGTRILKVASEIACLGIGPKERNTYRKTIPNALLLGKNLPT